MPPSCNQGRVHQGHLHMWPHTGNHQQIMWKQKSAQRLPHSREGQCLQSSRLVRGGLLGRGKCTEERKQEHRHWAWKGGPWRVPTWPKRRAFTAERRGETADELLSEWPIWNQAGNIVQGTFKFDLCVKIIRVIDWEWQHESPEHFGRNEYNYD